MSDRYIAVYHRGSMNRSSDTTTPTRFRTRTAILRAALSVFTMDRSAPLAEVANRAQVARSTLHRYFPERTDLTNALTEFASDEVEQVAERSRIHEGTALEALTRVALEYFEHWESVMWMYAESFGDSVSPEPSEFEIDINKRIVQGQADGSIDATLPAEWFQQSLFAIVYSAWEYERSGQPHAQAAMMVVATMRKIAMPIPDGVVVPPAQ